MAPLLDEFIGRGIRAISSAYEGNLKNSIYAAVVDEGHFVPRSDTQDWWLEMGLNPPGAEEQGILETWGRRSGPDDFQSFSPVAAPSAVMDKPKTSASKKNSRLAFKKLEPIRPAPAFDPSMMMMMQQMPTAMPKAAPKAMPQMPGGPPQAAPTAVAAAAPMNLPAGQAIQVTAGMDTSIVSKMIQETAIAIIGDVEEIDDDEPLMSAGLTSNTAVILRDQLTTTLPGIKLSPTLMFDYPSIGAITEYIMSQV